jgi:anti-sigma factor RsiW
MRCEDIRERLSAFLEGELARDENEQVEEHLAVCDACRDDLAGVEQVMSLLHGLEHEDAPPTFPQRVTAALDAAPAASRSRTRLFVSVALAASLALAVGLVVGTTLPRESAPFTAEGLQLPNESLQLPDEAQEALNDRGFAVAEGPSGERYLVLPAPLVEEAREADRPATRPVYLGGDESTEFFLEPAAAGHDPEVPVAVTNL